MAKTGSAALADELERLECEMAELNKQLENIEAEFNKSHIDDKLIKKTFRQAEKMFAEGNLTTNKKLIDNYVEKIMMYSTHIEVYFNVGFNDLYNIGVENNNLLHLKEDRNNIK